MCKISPGVLIDMGNFNVVKYKQNLVEVLNETPEFNINDLPINENDQVPSKLFETAASLPFLSEKNTFICVPIQSKETIWWCFGDVAINRSLDIEDVRVVLGGRYTEHFSPKTTDTFLQSSWSKLQRLFCSKIAIFAVPKDEQINFTSILLPVFAAIRNRPTFNTEIKRSSGVIRRDFEYALFLKKEEMAKKYLEEWQSNNRLDAENSIYLQIHLNLSLGNQHFILQNDYQKLKEVKDLNVPPSIRQQINEVLYSLVISSVTEQNDWKEALSKYTQEQLSLFSKFFDIEIIQSLESLVLATLDELSKFEPDLKKLQWLTSRDVVSDLPIINSISEKFLRYEEKPSPVALDLSEKINEVEELVKENKYNKAFVEVLKLEKSDGSLRLLAQILRHTLNDISRQKNEAIQALDFWHNTPKTLREQLTNSTPFEFQIFSDINKAINSLSENIVQDPTDDIYPETWNDWFALLNTDLCHVKVMKIFQKYYRTWSIKKLSEDQASINQFLEYLSNISASPQKKQLFEELFPTLLDEFIGESSNFDHRLKPIYFRFLEILILNESRLDLEIIVEVQQVLLECNLTLTETNELLEMLVFVLGENKTYQNLDIFIDTAELISMNVDVTNSLALAYFQDVRNLAIKFSHRLEDEQLHVLKMIYKDFSIELDAVFFEHQREIINNAGTHVDLNGKTIGIYSLIEDAAKRAAEYLNAKFPDSTIKLNNDKKCTERLRHLAKNADFFVFASKASKHQAFYCIKNNRPETYSEILIPNGKGSSSIIRSLMHEI